MRFGDVKVRSRVKIETIWLQAVAELTHNTVTDDEDDGDEDEQDDVAVFERFGERRKPFGARHQPLLTTSTSAGMTSGQRIH